MSKPARNKLKTLPNETNQKHEQFLFQSQSDDSHIKTINIASPTFATNELESLKNQNLNLGNRVSSGDNRIIPKQNKISLCLKQMRITQKDNENRDSKEKENNYQSNRKNDIAFFKGQNQKLVQKCKSLDQINQKLQQQNHILQQKLNICKKCVQQKFKQAANFMQMPNSSPTQSNMDLYLQLKFMKKNNKELKNVCQIFQSQNNILISKIQQLQQIVAAYTQKSQKKNKQRQQTGQKLKITQRMYHQKFEQYKRKAEIKQKQLQTQIKQKQKSLKKSKDQYQKLKFLKQQIQKKRQQDMKIKQQLQNRIKQKQQIVYTLKQQITKLQQQYYSLNNKYQMTNRSSQNIQQQFNKCQQQLTKLQLSFNSLQVQNNKYKSNLQSYKSINQKYSHQLIEIRKQNTMFYENVQTLKLQKDKLNSIITKHISTQDRQNRKIAQLQDKINQTQKQLDQVRFQLDQYIKSSSRNYHPNISKFKDDQQGSQKQSTFRATENQKTLYYQEQIKNIQEKCNKIVQELNKQIQQLRKCKQQLQNQIQNQRQKNQKINLQLQNTYRKIQQFGYTQDLQKQGTRGDFKQKDNRYMKRQFYGTSQILPLEFARATKATPQLKMIREILITILATKETEKINGKILSGFREKQRQRQRERQSFSSIQYLIDQIKKMAEQTADLFDDRSKQLQSVKSYVQNRQQVITRILRFTPQQKKSCILQYLNVMQHMDAYSVDQVYKVTKCMQEQGSQWKKTLTNLIQAVQKNEEQILQLRKQLARYKNQVGNNVGIRKYESTYGGTGIMGVLGGGRDRDKYERQRERERQRQRQRERDRYQDKYQHRRY